MKLEIEVTKITVLHRTGAVDYVWIETVLPYPFRDPTLGTNNNLTLTFQAPIGTGEEYVKKNFGRPVDEVING